MVIKDGEVVTFGVRVTNGALIYPAKAFRVEYKWQPRHRLPESPLINQNGTFHVFDADAEAKVEEEASNHSHESSVQIMESNIRTTTYSVPSDYDTESDEYDEDEDDDDLEISSVRGQDNEDSAATTPDQRVVHVLKDEVEASRTDNTKGKTLDLNLKGPKLQDVIAKAATEGSSQNNPIDLDDRAAQNTQDRSLRAPFNAQQGSAPDLYDVYDSSTRPEHHFDPTDARLPSATGIDEGAREGECAGRDGRRERDRERGRRP